VHDQINHPAHYTQHPSGVECIRITEHMGFCLGNAFKYIWRADLKGDAIEDLRKAAWYVQREIERRTIAKDVAEGNVMPVDVCCSCWGGAPLVADQRRCGCECHDRPAAQ